MSEIEDGKSKGPLGAALVPVPAILVGLGILASPASAATVVPNDHATAAMTASAVSMPASAGLASVEAFLTDQVSQTAPEIAVPALAPIALGTLSALVAWFGMRRKPD